MVAPECDAEDDLSRKLGLDVGLKNSGTQPPFSQKLDQRRIERRSLGERD
jgi:hypothetical protein